MSVPVAWCVAGGQPVVSPSLVLLTQMLQENSGASRLLMMELVIAVALFDGQPFSLET